MESLRRNGSGICCGVAGNEKINNLPNYAGCRVNVINVAIDGVMRR